MKRPWRKRLLLILLLTFPILVVVGGLFVMRETGNLGVVLVQKWGDMKMPGRLTVGNVEIVSSHEIQLTNVVIDQPGHQPPLATIRKITADVDLLSQAFHGIRAEGMHLNLDVENYDLLDAIVDAQGRIPPSDPPLRWTLDITDGSASIPGLDATGVRVHGDITGAEFAVDSDGHVSGSDRLAKVQIVSKALTPGSPNRRLAVTLEQAEVRAQTAWDAVVGIGLLPAMPEGVKPWLPTALLVADGTVVRRDLSEFRWQSDANLDWGSGRLKGQFLADRRHLSMDLVQFQDSGAIGSIDTATDNRPRARVEADLEHHTVTIRAESFLPGRRLPTLNGLPVEALRRMLPNDTLEWRLGVDPGTSLTLAAPAGGRAEVGVAWADTGPLRLTARELPMPLVRDLVPAWLRLDDGTIATAAITLEREPTGIRLSSLRADLRSASLAVGDWSLGPVDGSLQLRTESDGRMSITALTPFANLECTVSQGAAGGVTNAWSHAEGTLDLPTIEGLLGRLHGPAALPDLSGVLSADLVVDRSADGIAFTTRRLDLRGVEWRDRIRTITSVLKGNGRLQSTPQGWRFTGKVGGQLQGAQLRLGRGWLDLAAQTPIFTSSFDLSPAPNGVAVIVPELLVRSADPSGTPRPTGYSAGFRLSVDGSGSGSIEGLIDHVDLAWLNRQVPGLTPGSIRGDSAITGSGIIRDSQLKRLEGSFLPLSTDLTLGGVFHASGITGAVKFAMDLPDM